MDLSAVWISLKWGDFIWVTPFSSLQCLAEKSILKRNENALIVRSAGSNREIPMNKTSSDERRKCVRLKGHKKALLIQPNGMYQIRDISLGGLSFYCPRDVVFAPQWPIEIMIVGTLVCAIRVSVRLVREQTENVLASVSTPSKEVGVEYLALDDDNRPLLARLLSYLKQTAK